MIFREVDFLLHSRASLPRDLMAYPSIGKVMDLGTSLSWTMCLPGFDDQLKRRLLDANEYEAALYELRVARRHAQARQDVRFYEKPGQNEKGTDVRVFSGGKEVRVEAKRKDSIEVTTESNLPYQDLLNELIRESLEEFPYGMDVVAVILDKPSEASFREATVAVRSAVRNGERGSRFIRDRGLWLMVTDRNPITKSLEELKASIGFLPAKCRRRPGSPVSHPVWEASTFGLAAMPGPSVKSVLNSVSEASKQIGKGGRGIVYVHVNHGQQGLEIERSRLVLVGKALERRVWGGGLNTRIKAIVLTGGPYIGPYPQDGYIYPGTGYMFATIFRGDESPDDSGDVQNLLERVLRAVD
jgi:hypothetical protein